MANQMFLGVVFTGLALSASAAVVTADWTGLFPPEYAEGPFDTISVKRVGEELSELTRPSITVLYSPTDRRSQKMFPQFVTLAREFQYRGVDIKAYALCEPQSASKSFGFLRRHNAPFDAYWIETPRKGELQRELGKLGIEVGDTIKTPLVVVRDANGEVVMKKESVTGMAGLRERMLDAGLARGD